MNSKWIIGLGVIALVIAGVGATYVLKERPEATASGGGTADESLSGYRDAGRKMQVRAKKDYPSEQIPIGQLFSGDTRLVALSENERAWLESHHFLTQAELDAASGIPDEELKRDRSDARAQTIFGMRLLERGESVPAAAVLENAASHGSVYAYEEAALAQLKDAMANNKGRADENQINAFRARMEVAKILGDHRADALFEHYFPNYDAKYNAQTVQLQTTEFLRQLGLNAQVQGGQSVGPDPRPNSDLWENMTELHAAGGSSDLVPVYGP